MHSHGLPEEPGLDCLDAFKERLADFPVETEKVGTVSVCPPMRNRPSLSTNEEPSESVQQKRSVGVCPAKTKRWSLSTNNYVLEAL